LDNYLLRVDGNPAFCLSYDNRENVSDVKLTSCEVAKLWGRTDSLVYTSDNAITFLKVMLPAVIQMGIVYEVAPTIHLLKD
jgi:hypothetical protein